MNSEHEILAALWREAKKPSRNAATLTHNLGATFHFLETQWDDKARQIIGALVAVNASRMHTTIWAALFQQLRETASPTIKVYILKQFANVCWTVPLAQGANAFRAFAIEVRPLFSDIQIVTNSAFQKHFSTIIYFLKSFAEESLALDLFNTLYANLVEWKRVDAIRAVANVIAELSLRVPHCPPAELLLHRAKNEIEFFSYAILLETLITVDNTGDSETDPERLEIFCDELDSALHTIAEAFSENAKAVPSCMSAYRRLRGIRNNWEAIDAPALSTSILETFQAGKASKLLMCPYLQFLQYTSYNWWDGSTTIWKLTEDADPFVRADAFLALASKARFLDTSERKLTIAELFEKLQRFIDENCTYTTVAILKYLKILIFNPKISLAAQKPYLARLLHICCRFGREFKDDTPAQLELLTLLAAAAPAAPDFVQRYTLKLFLESNDRIVAERAFQTLAAILAASPPVSEINSLDVFTTLTSFVEGIFCEDADESCQLASTFTSCAQQSEILTAVINRRFLQPGATDSSEAFGTLVACDAVKCLCNQVAEQKNVQFASHHSTLTILSHFLLCRESMSSDVYVSLAQAAAACVALETPETCADDQLLEGLVQHSWSVLMDCAVSLKPEFSFAADAPASRFFRGDGTSFFLRELIFKCKDVALSNEVALYSSVFFQILESNIRLLAKCVEVLHFSPIFMCELIYSLDHIFKCCDTLFHCTPKLTLRLLRIVYSAVVSFEAASGLDAQLLNQLNFLFSNCCSSLVNRAITLDFLTYCPDLCEFLIFCLQQDSGKTQGAFSELISDNWSVIGDFSSFCQSISHNCSTKKERRTFMSLLRLLRSLTWSQYFPQLKEAVSRKLIEEIAFNFEQWNWFPEKAECGKIISDLQYFFVEENSANCKAIDRFFIATNIPTDDFFLFFESVVDLFNSCDAQQHAVLQQKLLELQTSESLISLAGVDNFFIPLAVEFLLKTPVECAQLDVLSLIISECKLSNLPCLEFYVSEAVLYEADEGVVELADNYRWGWFAGQKTKKMLLSTAWQQQRHVFSFFVERVTKATKIYCSSTNQTNQPFFTTIWDKKPFPVKHYLHSGVSAVDLLIYVSSTKFHGSCNAEEILISNSPLTLQLLHRFFISQENYEDLSESQIILLFAKHLSSVPARDLFLWDLTEWIALLRSWVSITLTTQPESDHWEWLQLGCWTLFYRFYGHLFEMAKTGHPKYPKENGASFFEELRRIYLQLSECFLCCQAGSVEEVAYFATRYALKNSALFESGSVDEEIFWCIARTCVDALWLVLKNEQCAPLHDPEVILFLCRTHVKIGLPLHIQRSIHTAFSPELRKYGNDSTGSRASSDNECLDLDAQRHALWLLGDFGSHFYLLATDANQDASATSASELKEYADFRSSVSLDLFRVAQETLFSPATSSATAVFDALGVLREGAQLNAMHVASLASPTGLSEVEQTYTIVRAFLASNSPLSADAPLQPASHCLRHLIFWLPSPRRACGFSDEYALALATTVLGDTLTSWLHRRNVLAAPPAQVPCMLAVYLPYMLRLDLPLYVAALRCTESVAVYGATAEVEAVFQVILARLAEDVVDLSWNSQLAVGWCVALITLLGKVAPCVHTGREQFARRLWEGVWRGAGSPDVCSSQELQEWAQRALRRLICDQAPKSAQWELARLVVLSSSVKRAMVDGGAGEGGTTTTEQRTTLSLRLVGSLHRSAWCSLLTETQAVFALRAGSALDPDSNRSLLFEFEKAVEALASSAKSSVTSVQEAQSYCFTRERVSAALLPATEATLAALNRFDFSSLERRRAVLHELAAMAIKDAQPQSPATDAAAASWAGVYFDILFERASCVDEGMWVACALATVEAGGRQLKWILAALQSLIAASSTRRKRIFLRRAGKLAKRNETQAQVRDFFAGANDRLNTSQAPLIVWKTELLVEATFVFSA